MQRRPAGCASASRPRRRWARRCSRGLAAVADAARLLASLGHDVEEAAPAVDGPLLARNYLHMYFGQVPAAMARAYAAGARRGEFEPLTRVIETLGKATSAAALTANLGQWNQHARALAAFHQRFDLLLTPTLAHPPVRHGAGDPPPAQQVALDCSIAPACWACSRARACSRRPSTRSPPTACSTCRSRSSPTSPARPR